MRKMFLFLVMSLIVVFCLLTIPLVSMANVRVEYEPGTGSGPPFYANLGGILPDGSVWTIHTDEWAAIPFYRDPDCVPEDFNLVNFLDLENASNCYSFVAGFEVWKNGPGLDPTPIQVNLKAVEPMPVYFIPWDILKVALEGYVLTMPELRLLDDVRIGIATLYTERLHDAAAQQYMDEVAAKGYMKLDSSVRFELKITWVHNPAVHKHVKIDFKTAKAAPALKPQSNIATTWGGMKGKY